MFYVIVAIKLILGLLALVLVINVTGKGNLAPASASDQVQNYVLGGIVGGVIYNTDISIPVFMLILAIWFAAVLSLRWRKKNNDLVKRLVDGRPVMLISRGKIDVKAARKVGLSAHDLAVKLRMQGIYSGLNLNQDKAASRRQYTRYGKASQRCTGLNLIHYSNETGSRFA